MVPLSPGARQSLSAYLAVREHFLPTRGKGPKAVKAASPWLFPSRGAEGHLTRHRVAQLLKKLADADKIDPAKVSPHLLRHALPIHLLAPGRALGPLQTTTGHP